MKQVLVTNSSKYEIPSSGKIILPPSSRNTIVFANGEEHSRQKRMLSPVFKIANLKGMVHVFQEKNMSLVKVQ